MLNGKAAMTLLIVALIKRNIVYMNEYFPKTRPLGKMCKLN